MSQPETVTQSPWALSELLGQRRLWGLGALLAWMVLFHLLVNIWLLCMFTSLLVVLGGWLGYQAVLDANSVLHLEHFISLKRVPNLPESELQLDREIQSTICKIIRDFVSSWYRSVSSEEEFEVETQRAMLAVAQGLKTRAQKVDRKALTQRVLDLCGCHLQSYIRVKEVLAEQEKNLVVDRDEDDRCLDSSLWKIYCKVCRAHPAMESSAAELNYARAIVDLLLHVLVPPPHLETRTGRFVVGELITCNVLLPLIAKMSDPDWLNLLIIDIFTKSSKQAVEDVDDLEATPPPLLTIQQQQDKVIDVPCFLNLTVRPETPLVTETPPPELAAYDVIDCAELYYQQDIEEEARQEGVANHGKPGAGSTLDYLRPDMFNPFYQESDSDQESPMSDFKKSSMESLILIGPEEGLTDRLCEYTAGIADQDEEPQGCPGLGEGCCPKVLVTEDLDQPENQVSIEGTKAERKSSWGNIYQDGVPEKESGSMKQAGRSNLNDLSIEGPPQTSGAVAGGVPLATFSFEPLTSPDGPVVIQNLRITGTITAKEHKGSGSHLYTLYTVKYETTVETENPGTFHSIAYHMVNRRYSEFLNLQTRLEEKADLRKVIKNVKGPKKPFPDLSFGNVDIDKVGARKGQLETFLKQLCNIPETANSEEVQEFLALNTDARIAFVKKPFVVSRIDKIVVNAIVDTLKTAFPRSEPQSPTEEPEGEADGKAQSDGKKTKSRLRFSSKISPALNLDELQPKVQYCFNEENTVFNGLSLTALEGFLKEQEKALSRARDLQETKGSEENRDPVSSACLENRVQGAETALADVALNILCLLMKDQWSWLCTENVQKTIRLLFGTFIDRWLDVGMANLTSTPCWVIYLRVLQEAVWPEGTLPTQPRPARSSQQKEETRQQSLQCLMKLLPDLIPDLLGSEKYRLSWQAVLESLQDPQINRHLVYSVCDLLLEVLIPESSDEVFQRSLLSSLCGTARRPSA
ncbi:sorting nexin-19-like isoform X2 [Anguilla rostrata]|uniref:sorting nexin-19-like isoform X2 n=1 Tax=Anguilla rostrata TaxID=7938 RepID=UPI0030CF93B2